MAVILFGHGTFDGDWAKFNLEGPDLRELDWTQMLDRLPATRLWWQKYEKIYAGFWF